MKSSINRFFSFIFIFLLIFSSLNALIWIRAVNAGSEIRIMPLGDSITYGSWSESSGGYRQKLFLDLSQTGFNVDFVGALSSPNSPAREYPRDCKAAFEAE